MNVISFQGGDPSDPQLSLVMKDRPALVIEECRPELKNHITEFTN